MNEQHARKTALKRAWRKRNPERSRAASRRWRERNPERKHDIDREYHRRNRETYTSRMREARKIAFLSIDDPMKCESPGCPRRRVSNGLCERHLSQKRRGVYTGRPPVGWRSDRPWLITADDGIVDEMAVQIAVDGLRTVRLTETERKLAVKMMAERGLWVSEIKERLAANGHFVCRALREAGYDILPDGTGCGHTTIVPKNRPEAPNCYDQTGGLSGVFPTLFAQRGKVALDARPDHSSASRLR